jgi:hypothetical protein
VALRKTLAMHAVTLLLLLPGAARAWPTNLYVFGDSLLDSGNAYAITETADPLSTYPISPPYAQRFSNGPVASEVLASELGVTAVPSQLWRDELRDWWRHERLCQLRRHCIRQPNATTAGGFFARPDCVALNRRHRDLRSRSVSLRLRLPLTSALRWSSSGREQTICSSRQLWSPT